MLAGRAREIWADRRAWPALALVVVGGMIAALVSAVFLEALRNGTADQPFPWNPGAAGLLLARFAVMALWLVPAFLLVWLLTNGYVHHRTAVPLPTLLFRDAFFYPLLAPFVGVLIAFGPGDPRPRFMTTVGLVYLAVLAIKLWPLGIAAVGAHKPVRGRDVGVAVLAVYLGLFIGDHPRYLTGDEPHYLVIANNIARDGGLELTNDYANRVYAPYFRSSLAEHVVVVEKSPGVQLKRPRHYPGLPVLVLPAFVLAGATGAKLVVLLIATAGLLGLFSLLVRLKVSHEVAGRATVLMACTSPFVTYGLNLYPEIIGAAILAWGVWAVLEKEFDWFQALTVGLLAAALPWLQIRYAPLSAVLGFGALARCRLRAKPILALVLPALVSAAGLVAYICIVYGGFCLSKLQGFPSPEHFSYLGSLSLKRSVTYFFAAFLDSGGGVFVYAPILILAPLGGILLYRRNRPVCAMILAALIGEIALIAGGWELWYGGWSPPSRYVVCISPLLAVLAILAYQEVIGDRLIRTTCHVLLGAGALFGLLMVSQPYKAIYNLHQAGAVPAFSKAYPFIPLHWVFPNYADAGLRPVVLTLLWLTAIILFTALLLRRNRRKQSAADSLLDKRDSDGQNPALDS